MTLPVLFFAVSLRRTLVMQIGPSCSVTIPALIVDGGIFLKGNSTVHLV